MLKNEAFLKLITECSEVVFLSPHFDDAILSAGGLLSYLAAAHKPIRVFSVFTAASDLETNETKKLVSWGGFITVTDYIAARHLEDQEAIASLGEISVSSLGFTDSVWRTDDSGQPLYRENAIGVINDHDRALIPKLTTAFQILVKNPQDTAVFGPLAIGRHVDHYLVREAVINAFPHAFFYADYPYTENYPDEDEFVRENGLEKAVLTAIDAGGKEAAIRLYKTQLRSLYGKYKMELTHETFYFKP